MLWVIYPKHSFNIFILFYYLKAIWGDPFMLGITSLIIIFLIRRNQSYGCARWAKYVDIPLFNKNSGVILAKSRGRKLYAKKNSAVLLLGSANSGKTKGFILPNLKNTNCSFVILDNSNLYEKTSKTLKKSSKVYTLDFTAANGVFNPFSKGNLPPLNKQDYIKNMVNCLIENKYENNGILVYEAKKLLILLINYLVNLNNCTDGKSVRDALEDKKLYEILSKIKSSTASEIMDNIFIGNTLSKKGNLIKILILEGIELFDFGNNNKKYDEYKGPKLSNIREGNISIYVKIEEKEIKKYRSIIILFFEAVDFYLYYKSDSKKRVVFLLDDFTKYGFVGVFSNWAVNCVKLNIDVLFTCCDYQHLLEYCDKNMMMTLENSCAYKIILRQNNLYTAKRIEQIIGKATQDKISYIRRKGVSSYSISKEGASLVAAQEVLNLKKKQCLVLEQGYFSRPIKARVPF
jgi:type IV secretion system protein VirD4